VSQFDEKLNQILSDPNTMNQIMSIASSLSGGESGASSPPAEAVSPLPATQATTPAPAGPDLSALSALLGGSGLDAATLGKLGSLTAQLQGEDEKTALLNALRPFLRPERAERVDRVIQLTRLSRVVKAALTLLRKEAD
jgi:hypothetical protein